VRRGASNNVTPGGNGCLCAWCSVIKLPFSTIETLMGAMTGRTYISGRYGLSVDYIVVDCWIVPRFD
jgi:hypothetical protein